MQKLIILGAQGMLGMELTYYFQGKYEVFPLAEFNLDITNKGAIEETFSRIQPDLVINAAAYTNVERAEAKHERNVAMKVNGDAVGYLAEVCSQRGIGFVQISTDYVFDGTKGEPYSEADLPNPQNMYGKSKMLGEQKIQEWANLNPDWNYYIVRTAWLYGQYGPNFVKKMLHFAKKRREVKVVEDQFGSPTWTLELVKGVEEIVEQKKYTSGVYHLTGKGEASWADLAEEVFEICKTNTAVIRVGSSEFPQVAKRPAYSVLQNIKGPEMKGWREMLGEYLGG